MNVRANLYIAGNADEGFGFYGHIGAAILGYKDQMQTGTYDTNLFVLPTPTPTQKKLNQLWQSLI